MAPLIFASDGLDTPLSRINPIAKLLGLIAISLSAYTFPAITLGAVAIISYASGIPLLKRLWEGKVMLLMAILIGVVGIANEGFSYSALDDALSFLAVFSGAIAFTAATDPIDLAVSAGSFLEHIIGKKRAWPLAADIMLTISILPAIFTASSEMLDARLSRGSRFAHHPVRYLSEYTVSLVLHLMIKMEALSDGLEARSYDRSARRSAPHYRLSDIILIVAFVAMILGLTWIKLR